MRGLKGFSLRFIFCKGNSFDHMEVARDKVPPPQNINEGLWALGGQSSSSDT